MQTTSKYRIKYLLYIVIGIIVFVFFVFSLYGIEIFQRSVTFSKRPEQHSKITDILEQPINGSKIRKTITVDKNTVKVLCWVMTAPQNHLTKAIHVKRTWGKRCNKLIFISEKDDSIIGAVAVPIPSTGRNGLWGKTRFGFKYAWDHYKDEYDWFMKADDDTYVIVDNLKKFLAKYSPFDAIYFGCQFSSPQIPSWTSGGSGYVLSKEALRLFVQDALPNAEKCQTGVEGSEDANMGKCLEHVGVTLRDSRDHLGRHRFLAFTPPDHLFPHEVSDKDKEYWYWKDLTYPQSQGMNCCANDAITFHYIDARQMYVLEYFLYHIRPDGVDREQEYAQEYPLEYTTKTSSTTTVIPTNSTRGAE